MADGLKKHNYTAHKIVSKGTQTLTCVLLLSQTCVVESGERDKPAARYFKKQQIDPASDDLVLNWRKLLPYKYTLIMMLQLAVLIVPVLQRSSVSAFCGLSQSAIARRSSALFTATFDPAVSSRTEVSTREESSSDQWLLESLEKEDRCVIGPKEVLVYDTTLRGTYTS